MRFCILPSYILAKLYNISYSNKIVIYYQGDEICIFEYLFTLVIKEISLIIHLQKQYTNSNVLDEY